MEDGARVCKRSIIEKKRTGGRKEKGMRYGRREGGKERKYGEAEGDWDGGRR